ISIRVMAPRILLQYVFSMLFICIAAHADEYLETIPLPGNDCLGSAAKLNSGNILAAGVDFTNNDILLMTLSSNGTVLKAQRISTSAADGALTVVGSSDGGAVVGGSTSSFGAGNTDSFLLKIRSS